MRISDWSSNVCSSDLYQTWPPLIVGTRTPAGTEASASAVGSLVPVVRGSHRGLPVDRLGIVFGLAVLLLVLFFQALLEGVDALTHVTHQLRNRSEEHTSELQSLMRISYAVFCLKKKTKQK